MTNNELVRCREFSVWLANSDISWEGIFSTLAWELGDIDGLQEEIRSSFTEDAARRVADYLSSNV